tara:strand:+ start:5952 stop:6113 length:162 start_codon:yes stop_codon:yes gene_type:complete
MLKLSSQFVRHVNNTHVRAKISKNIMPRLYKDVSKKKEYYKMDRDRLPLFCKK